MNLLNATASPHALISGLLLINKPSGPTSYDMIRWVKRSLPGIKIGHSGTLDPLASGLMVLLLGKATKDQDLFMKMEKTYLFTIKLGIQTDTGDLAGTIIREVAPIELTKDKIEAVLSEFCGSQTQIPPMYSALKRNGVPLYKLARKGETVERMERRITIHELSLLEWTSSELKLRVRCSSGTYVRTLAEDIAVKLGSCGVMSYLVREKIGPYSLSQALPGDDLKIKTADEIGSAVLPLLGR